ncbi:polysaccharide deacetylase family protein [Micromonospora sp. NPDC003197]
MSRRAAPAALLALSILLLGGCADGDRTSAHPAPDASGSSDATAPAPDPTEPTKPAQPPTSRPTTPAPTKSPTRSPGNGEKKTGPYGTRRLTGSKAVALTFDDGPHPVWTPKVLDQLREAKVQATFCLVGTKVRQHPDLVARIVREGHSLCNHSWQHDLELGKKPEADIRADLERTNREIVRAVPGAKVGYYRQPGGKWTPAVTKISRSLGMVPLHWDVDPRDWDKPDAATIQSRVLRQAQAGSIVLLHDGGGDRANTVAACPQILSTLRKRYGIRRL